MNIQQAMERIATLEAELSTLREFYKGVSAQRDEALQNLKRLMDAIKQTTQSDEGLTAYYENKAGVGDYEARRRTGKGR